MKVVVQRKRKRAQEATGKASGRPRPTVHTSTASILRVLYVALKVAWDGMCKLALRLPSGS